MTINEFSWEFDVLYNNISNGNAPGVNEYEKSVFLTRAQEQIVTELYTGTGISNGFDSSEQIRQYLNSLVKTISIPENKQSLLNHPTYDITDNKVLFILNMYLKNGNIKIPVFPITYDEYNITTENPFKLNKRRALGITSSNSITVISKYENDNYSLVVSYLSKPTPIIVADLDEVTIDTLHTKTEIIETPESLHFEIVKRAVQLALTANGAIE